MLLLTRKPGQAITIQPEQGTDFATPVGVLFNQGPIEIRVTQARGQVLQITFCDL